MKGITKKWVIYLDFMILMIALGVSDALRGVFAPIFQSHFTLSATRLSVIITVSYVGNLVFLFVGTRFADKYSRKRVFAVVILLWMAALVLYLLTDSYSVLLVGMFIAMGASTLLNTMINLLTPLMFAAPGLIINTLFFTQGIGTSASQSLIGSLASGFGWWKLVNAVLLILGVLSFIIFMMLDIPEKTKDSTLVQVDMGVKAAKGKMIFRQPVFWYFFWAFGLYFIAEHGILNWLLIYCREELMMETGKASLYLSMFFGGVTIGRLVIAPFVQKMGTLKSIRVFGSIGALLYVMGIVPPGGRLLGLLGLSGLFLSIIYPTLVLAVQGFYREDQVSSATGVIISAATVFDIAFNAIFGKIIDAAGFRVGFMILPVSMVCFVGVFWLFTKRVKPIRDI